MNRILLSVFLFCLIPFLAPAQSATAKETYKTETNIPYRSGGNLDEYMKERCKLDLYLPENTTNFTTVVWFHGGGLTAGEKSIPEHDIYQTT